ncbi:MerR family transcriptional regulator [Geomonas sp. RF6]|uniref:MerR family transcriptional regulator n=1 Tax=Geomonas sp. RF6 TaxID=2897342 RepID=UPI002ED92BBE
MRIGEISELTGLPSSVLRYWESEFPSLTPKKSSTGQRLYTKKDLELIVRIKQLLYVEKLTIEGARKRLGGKLKAQEAAPVPNGLAELLREVKEELREMRDILVNQA